MTNQQIKNIGLAITIGLAIIAGLAGHKNNIPPHHSRPEFRIKVPLREEATPTPTPKQEIIV